MEKKKKDEEKGKKIKKRKEKKKKREEQRKPKGGIEGKERILKSFKGPNFNWHTNHIPRNKRKNAKAGHLQTSKKRHPHSKYFLPRAC